MVKNNIEPGHDSIFDTIILVWLQPIFKIIHKDKYNIILWSLIAFFLITTNMYLCFVLMPIILSIFIIRMLCCGRKTVIYNKYRRYGNSYLNPEEASWAVMHLNEDTHYNNGYAYGKLLHKEILYVINRFKPFYINNIKARDIGDIYSSLPTDIKDELLGLYDALSSTFTSVQTYDKISFNDLISFQLLPETSSVGCTCIGAYDYENNLIFGRNMDWLPLSSAQYSIIINYSKYGYKSLVAPGLIGCITGWRNEFKLAMNVVGIPILLEGRVGIPSTLFNKHIMNTCKTFKDASEIARTTIPFAPYHLTLADNRTMHRYSFHQHRDSDKDDICKSTKTHIEILTPSSESSMKTFNCAYPCMTMGRAATRNRHNKLANLTMSNVDDVVKALKLCNTSITVHSLIFYNGYIYVGIDNGYAADSLKLLLI
jgi:hypothetical protein